jgi:hypothetical protein
LLVAVAPTVYESQAIRLELWNGNFIRYFIGEQGLRQWGLCAAEKFTAGYGRSEANAFVREPKRVWVSSDFNVN